MRPESTRMSLVAMSAREDHDVATLPTTRTDRALRKLRGSAESCVSVVSFAGARFELVLPMDVPPRRRAGPPGA